MAFPSLLIVTGPESTGKSTLAKHLSHTLSWPLVEEYARTYIDLLNRPYAEADLYAIAKKQLLLETVAQHTQKHIICDTDLLTIQIWAEEKYGHCQEWVKRHLAKKTDCLYLLSKPTLPWAPDPQRENPHDRKRLYAIYKRYLEEYGKMFWEVDLTAKGVEEWGEMVSSLGGL